MATGATYRTLIISGASLMLVGCLQQGTPLVTERSPNTAPKPKQAPVVRETPSRPPATRVPVQERASGTVATNRSAAAPQIKPRTRPSRGNDYVVQRGDTLYSIAWRYNLDPKGLAYANRVPAPYTIFPGQRLKLRVVAPPPAKRPPAASMPSAPQPSPRSVPNSQTTELGRWSWPMNGKPTTSYSKSRKGVDFELPQGAKGEVRASNAGKVVYAGNGIGGYEQLIIIKHSDTLLSAYSFNGATRIAEQVSVKVGQKIADILPVGRTIPKLHFEIRKDGEPVNPQSYIKGA